MNFLACDLDDQNISHGFGREKIGGLKIEKKGAMLQNWLCDGPYLDERKLAL